MNEKIIHTYLTNSPESILTEILVLTMPTANKVNPMSLIPLIGEMSGSRTMERMVAEATFLVLLGEALDDVHVKMPSCEASEKVGKKLKSAGVSFSIGH